VKSGTRERSKSIAAATVAIAAVAWFFAPYLTGELVVADRDALSAVLPVKLFLATSLHRGEMPWWDPAPALGKPFFADPLPGVLSPGNLLLLVPPFARGYGWFLVGHYLWTALGAERCLRTVGLPALAALVGALVWALGGALVSLANVANHLSAIAWLPWVLYAWSRPRRAPARVAWAALAMAPVFLAGSPEMIALVAVALLLWSADVRALLVPVLAAGLSAVEVVPILAYARETWRAVQGFSPDAAARFAAPPVQLAQLVIERGPLAPTPFLRSVYVGPVAAGLAVVGAVAAPRGRRAVLIALAIAVSALALGDATPLFPFLTRTLPLASVVRYPGKALVALHAVVAVAAAFGAARAIAASRRVAARSTGALRAAALAAPAALALAAVVPLALVTRSTLAGVPSDDVLAPPAVARAIASDASAGSAAPLGLDAARGADVARAPVRYYSNGTGIPPATSSRDALRLDRDLLFAATGELWGLANVNTPSSLNLVAHELLQRALGASERDGALGALAALGTRYATTWVPFDGSAVAREVPIAGGGGGVHLYRLDGAAPRAFVARRIVVARDLLASVGRFALSRPGTHAGLAVVEEPDAARLRERLGLELREVTLPENPHAVRWLADEPAVASLEVEVASPGLLVVNDTWADGWTATIDGESEAIARVNGLVRGVPVLAGRHLVEMRYRPPGLATGALLSLASALAVALLLGRGHAPR